MQMIIYAILVNLLDKKVFFLQRPLPLSQKTSMVSFRVNNAVFLDFIWGKDENGVKKQWVGGGVEEKMGEAGLKKQGKGKLLTIYCWSFI